MNESKDYFGHCPRCCREPVRRDVGSINFMCCDTCRIYWSIGTILTSDEFQENRDLLGQYEEMVAPLQ